MATEVFANEPSTTVTAGGTTAPSAGTSESWTVTSSASFPAAVTGLTQFHVSDPLHPSELVTVTNVSGTTWTVTRGAESTTPVAHTTGFTIQQVVTAGGLSAFLQSPQYSPNRGPRPQRITFLDEVWMGQAGHPFTFTGTGSTGSNADTSDFVLGTEACYVTTNGSGANTKISGTLGQALNMTGKSLVVWIKMVTYGNFLGGYPRLYLGDTGLSNAWYWHLTEAAGQPYALDGEWLRLTLPFGTATQVGSPSRSSLAALTIQIFDNSAGPVTLHFGGVATMAEPEIWPNGVVSITFDDGLISQFNTAKPLMDVYGYGATAYLITETLWNHSSYPGYYDIPTAQALEKYSGWEMGAHAYTVADHNASYTGISDAAALADMQAAKNYLQMQGFRSPELFAYPLGNYDAATLVNVSQFFGAARSISQLGGFPDETFPPADLLRLRCQTLGNLNSLASAEAAVDRAYANKEWLIFTLHDIVTSANTNTQFSTANFTALLAYIAAKGIPVRLVSDVLKSGALAEVAFVSSIAAADTSIVLSGTAAAPTVATGTLDVIATQHAPAAPVPMNSQKFTGLANGSAATDSAAFGQIPVVDSTATDIVQVGTAAAAGAIGKWADAGHVHAAAEPVPADTSLIAWNMDPAVASQSNSPTPGTVYILTIYLRTAATLSNVILRVVTVSSFNLTSTQNYAALFDSGGTQRAITADQTSNWGSAGVKTSAFTSSYPAAAGKYYVALLMNGSGTTYTWAGGSGVPSFANAGVSGASLRFSVNGTLQTSMPNGITPSSNTNTGALPHAILLS